MLAWMYSANWTGKGKRQLGLLSIEFHMVSPVSPASPENAISVCLLSSLVLSSVAFKIVAPLIAAFEAATIV